MGGSSSKTTPSDASISAKVNPAPLQSAASNANLLRANSSTLLCRECRQPIIYDDVGDDNMDNNSSSSSRNSSNLKKMDSINNIISRPSNNDSASAAGRSLVPDDENIIDENIERMVFNSSNSNITSTNDYGRAADTPLITRHPLSPSQGEEGPPDRSLLAASLRSIIESVKVDLQREEESSNSVEHGAVPQYDAECYARVFAKLLERCDGFKLEDSTNYDNNYYNNNNDNNYANYTSEGNSGNSNTAKNSIVSEINVNDNISDVGDGAPAKGIGVGNSKIFYHTHYFLENGHRPNNNNNNSSHHSNNHSNSISNNHSNTYSKNHSAIHDVNNSSPGKFIVGNSNNHGNSPNIRQVDHIIKKRY